MNAPTPAIWFPAVRTGTGTDSFTLRLVNALNRCGLQAEVAWLPARAEFAPWTVNRLVPPAWANIAHINSWLHTRFIPQNLPLVTTIHGCVHDPALMPYKGPLQSLYHRHWIRRIEASALARSEVVTAVSHYTAERSTAAFRRTGIVPISNWIETDRFTPSSRDEMGQPFRLLFVGKLSRRKGKDLLPEIMRRLGPDFTLCYTGHPAEFGADRKLPDNMNALGLVTDRERMLAHYRESDALLFPTRLEGLSLALLEAMACGLPVIATDASSLPEAVTDGVSGLLCPQDDIDAFVTAAITLKNDVTLWRKMRLASRAAAEARFNEEKAVHRYVDLYRRLLHDRGRIDANNTGSPRHTNPLRDP